MSSWIFLLSIIALPATLGWIPDIVKLNDAELGEINEKCASKSDEKLPGKPHLHVTEKTAAPRGHYPFMAFVGNDKQFLCGAVFVSRRHLLTVRDCLWVPRRTGLKISVYAAGECYGESNSDCNNGVDMKAIAVDVAIFDGQEWGTDTRDLALVQILNEVPNNNSVLPLIDFACLPEKDVNLPSSAIVIGWGRMDHLTPPKHLQHAPIELKSADHEGNFLGRISYSSEIPNEFENRLGRKFAKFGSNSSAGNAVVSYSSDLNRYVLNGLLVGSSWSSRFGRTFSDGVKIAPFLADLCHRLRLCVNGVDHVSTAPKLRIVSRYSPKEEGGGGAAYGFAGGYAEGHSTLDGRYCHQEMTGTIHEVGNRSHPARDKRLVHYNVPGGYVDVDGEVNATEIIEFDLGNAWNLARDKWFHADRPQLSVKVCPKFESRGLCENGLTFCWRNGFGKDDEPTQRDIDINSKCQGQVERDFFNGIRITRKAHGPFDYAFLHSNSEKLVKKDVPLIDGCWYFRFIKWHESMKKYNFGIIALENPAFLPYIELYDKTPTKRDTIKLKVVGSPGCKLVAKLESDYVTPCYRKWVPMKMGVCGNEGGYNKLKCTRKKSYTMSRSTVTQDVLKGEMDKTEVEKFNNITKETTKTVDTMVEKTAEDHATEIKNELEVTLSSEIAASGLGFTAKVSSELAIDISEKMSTKISNSLTESLTKTASKEITTKLQTVKTLQSINKTCTEKLEEVKETQKVETMTESDIDPGIYRETCALQYVCQGQDSVSNIAVPFYRDFFHPPRDDNFT